MAALETTTGYWYAHFGGQTRRVVVERTKWDHEPVPFFWCMIDGVGRWPGTESEEWIEYIPESPACTGLEAWLP